MCRYLLLHRDLGSQSFKNSFYKIVSYIYIYIYIYLYIRLYMVVFCHCYVVRLASALWQSGACAGWAGSWYVDRGAPRRAARRYGPPRVDTNCHGDRDIQWLRRSLYIVLFMSSLYCSPCPRPVRSLGPVLVERHPNRALIQMATAIAIYCRVYVIVMQFALPAPHEESGACAGWTSS